MVYLLPAFFLTQCPNKNSPTSAGPGQIYKKRKKCECDLFHIFSISNYDHLSICAIMVIYAPYYQ